MYYLVHQAKMPKLRELNNVIDLTTKTKGFTVFDSCYSAASGKVNHASVEVSSLSMVCHSQHTHVDGAAHQRVSLVCFRHNLKQIRWHILFHVKHFSHSTCEVFHCFTGWTAFQALVGSMQPINSSQTSHNAGSTAQCRCAIHNINPLINTDMIVGISVLSLSLYS